MRQNTKVVGAVGEIPEILMPVIEQMRSSMDIAMVSTGESRETVVEVLSDGTRVVESVASNAVTTQMPALQSMQKNQSNTKATIKYRPGGETEYTIGSAQQTSFLSNEQFTRFMQSFGNFSSASGIYGKSFARGKVVEIKKSIATPSNDTLLSVKIDTVILMQFVGEGKAGNMVFSHKEDSKSTFTIGDMLNTSITHHEGMASYTPDGRLAWSRGKSTVTGEINLPQVVLGDKTIKLKTITTLEMYTYKK
jgi:hypothetical protein